MVGELTPVAVDPTTADREFWTRFHELRRLWDIEEHPDDPVAPDEVVEKRMKKVNPFDTHEYFEITREGQMLSWLSTEHAAPANPEYPTNKHLMWASGFVRAAERRKGIATLWLPFLARFMEELGCTVVGSYATQETGHAFLKHVGAEPKLSDIESRLRLSEVDWPMMRRWVAEGQERSPQTKLEIYDGPLPEAMWPEFARRRSELLNTIPFENLDIGEIIITPERMRFFYEQAAQVGDVLHNVLTREPNGVISGMTDVTWAPHRPRLIEQDFTGVRPDARGRGLGKWIKAAMVLHIHDLYPEAEAITTGNAGSNAPMLKINRAMGFKTYQTGVEYQMSLDKLKERIGRKSS